MNCSKTPVASATGYQRARVAHICSSLNLNFLLNPTWNAGDGRQDLLNDCYWLDATSWLNTVLKQLQLLLARYHRPASSQCRCRLPSSAALVQLTSARARCHDGEDGAAQRSLITELHPVRRPCLFQISPNAGYDIFFAAHWLVTGCVSLRSFDIFHLFTALCELDDMYRLCVIVALCCALGPLCSAAPKTRDETPKAQFESDAERNDLPHEKLDGHENLLSKVRTRLFPFVVLFLSHISFVRKQQFQTFLNERAGKHIRPLCLCSCWVIMTKWKPSRKALTVGVNVLSDPWAGAPADDSKKGAPTRTTSTPWRLSRPGRSASAPASLLRRRSTRARESTGWKCWGRLGMRMSRCSVPPSARCLISPRHPPNSPPKPCFCQVAVKS